MSAERIKRVGQNSPITLSPGGLDVMISMLNGERENMRSWHASGVEVRPSLIQGIGLFATRDLAPNTTVGLKTGHEVPERFVQERRDEFKGLHQQVSKNTHIVGLTDAEIDAFGVGYNNDCDAKLWLRIIMSGRYPVVMVNTRDVEIANGDELGLFYNGYFTSRTQYIEDCRCDPMKKPHSVDPSIPWTSLDPAVQQKYEGEVADFVLANAA